MATEETVNDNSSIPFLLEEDHDVVMEDAEEETTPLVDSQPMKETFGGLRNLGNTCYLNSALQMLASLDCFPGVLTATTPVETDEEKLALRQSFLELMKALRRGETIHPEDFKKAMDSRSSLFVGYRQQDSHEFLTTLLDLLDEDYQKKPEEKPQENNKEDDKDEKMEKEVEKKEDFPTESKPSEVTSEPTAEIVNASNAVTTNKHRAYSDLDVNDISELLHGESQQTNLSATYAAASTPQPQCKLVGGRAIPLDESDTLCQSDSDSDEVMEAMTPESCDEAHRGTEDGVHSPVEDYFCTEVRSHLVCDSCKYSRNHVEKFFHLSLDIGESDSVEDGLRKFFQPEKLNLKCEKCFCESATQTKEIIKAPRALLLHLKRFIVDVSPDYTSITYRKNQSPVAFEDKINVVEDGLEGFFSSNVSLPATRREFQIRSIVNHIGSSASCGHYTADSHRLYRTGEREWTRFNDSNVSRIAPNEAMSESSKKTAYLILYELV
eukprot:CAMPEP_0116845014 /NCGR_PEP_ID=MMETSP0418-20121206/13024_1 /TAXON_ID=1158023 /ORGANISM="Astrosyne radiata, Strain 13vi08-1A" /LENGTH=494 /DNA_ID=CAMNT_0004476063 /DNA_START=174 /DNA_END=1658 /DNA_ORIENTATION=-